ncbi:MAG: hypothetical protein IT242_01565 [Bacteroidia bacterium]|nr:hypothetical protein [Bacteroidia bacterium]
MINKARGLIRENKIQDAISYSFNILNKAEALRDTISILSSYNLLGWAYMELGKYREAVTLLNRGLRVPGKENFSRETGTLCANIASCYNNMSMRDSGFYYIGIAIKWDQQAQNLSGLANALNIRSSLYLKENKLALAQKDLENALTARKNIGDVHYILADMAQLASFYGLAGQPEKGIELAKNGIRIAEKSNNLARLIFLTMALADNYKIAGRTSDYSSTLEKLMILKDTLAERNSSRVIAEMSAKYQLQKKGNIIIQQQYDLEKRSITISGLVVLLILSFFLFRALFRNYKLVAQQKVFSVLAEQKVISEKAVILAREIERKRISADLHDNLGAYAAAISTNVKYLKEERLEPIDGLIEQLDENAQNIVTQLSETIWVLKNESLTFTSLVDRLKLWIQKLMQSYPSVRYQFSENISLDKEFSPTNALHLFFIMKESVNNALRHSKCSEIHIRFECVQQWKICIEDNGQGMSEVFIPSNRGIGNIKNRATQCDCHVRWEEMQPNGVRVCISEPEAENIKHEKPVG